MTRMTKKKETSEAQQSVATKAKSSGAKLKKATLKTEASAQKAKKSDSQKTREEKVGKKASAASKAKTKTVLKEKPLKTSPEVKNSKKRITSTKTTKKLPTPTLFPEVEAQVSLTPEKTIPKKQEITNLDSIKKIQHSQILAPELIPPPEYKIPPNESSAIKTIQFENLIPDDKVISVVKRHLGALPSKTLQSTLNAALRGSDLLLTQEKKMEGALLGCITCSVKLNNESFPKGANSKPTALFLTTTQEESHEIFELCSKIFKDLSISCIEVLEKSSSENFNSPFDVCISSIKNLAQCCKAGYLKLDQVCFCLLGDLQNIQEDSIEELEKILTEIQHDRCQKVINSQKNSPFIREVAFKFLEDPEYINLLPLQIKERQPKQFAHALTATQKFQVLLGHLKNHKPNCAIVFANTKSVAEWLAFKLHNNDIKVELVTGYLTPQKRKALVNTIKEEQGMIIVATDVLAKNLGATKLNCIYNFDLPDSPDTFIDRLSRIEGSRNPISVSFVCEDYGFNMGAIENKLGFKIHIAIPDKSYFSIKDTSPYPLEADGKVKRIGVVYEDITAKEQSEEKPIAPAALTEKRQKPVAAPLQPKSQEKITEKLLPREKTEQPPAHATAADSSSRTSYFTAANGNKNNEFKRPQTTFENKQNTESRYSSNSEKFSRRDERAKEAIDAAKMAAQAAQQKRKERTTADKIKQKPKRLGLLEIAVSLVQDAVHSAAVAAKDSLAQNIEHKLPTLSVMLDKFKILKKPNEKNQEIEK